MMPSVSFGNWIVGYPDRARNAFARLCVIVLIFTPGMGKTVTGQMTAQEAKRLERVERVLEDTSKVHERLNSLIRANTEYIRTANTEQGLRMDLFRKDIDIAKRDLTNDALAWTMGTGGIILVALIGALYRIVVYLGRKMDKQMADTIRRLEMRFPASPVR